MDIFGFLASGSESRVKGGLYAVIKHPLGLIFRIFLIQALIIHGSGSLNDGKH
jgi:hypothetical protein